jgi:hypothetical protein
MTQFSLDALDLAALLSSRVCHDVISPVGAIVNGLEVMEDKDMDAEMRSHALALIKSSAGEASARLQFCRLAFGAAGSKGASILNETFSSSPVDETEITPPRGMVVSAIKQRLSSSLTLFSTSARAGRSN